MGFGVDRQKDAARLWKFPILYTLEGSLSDLQKSEIVKAMKMWGEPFFLPLPPGSPGTDQPPIKIVCNESGSTQWRSGDGMNGKAPGKAGMLTIKPTTGFDSMVHEFGHVLGLAHEHDRPDAGNYRKTLTVDFVEQVAAAAQKKYIPYGAFDPNSIMCYGTKNEQGPSKGDLETIVAMYDLKTRVMSRRNL